MYLAYKDYYTHSGTPQRLTEPAATSFLRRLRRSVRNAYLNKHFGTACVPALRGSAIGFHLLPRRRLTLDNEFRHLHRTDDGSRLLDVGCGNGFFLAHMQGGGWQAEGLDPDPDAASTAANQGLSVRVGFLTENMYEEERFDALTMNHVLEHLHNPAETLRICYKILRRNGTIWIATPNINSDSHRHFGRHWRGLEAPRHLMIVNPGSMRRLLRDAGFCSIRFHSNAFEHTRFFYEASDALRKNVPFGSSVLSRRLRRRVAIACVRGWLMPARAEQVIVSAKKV